jgi:hypothetical protein
LSFGYNSFNNAVNSNKGIVAIVSFAAQYNNSTDYVTLQANGKGIYILNGKSIYTKKIIFN